MDPIVREVVKGVMSVSRVIDKMLQSNGHFSRKSPDQLGFHKSVGVCREDSAPSEYTTNKTRARTVECARLSRAANCSNPGIS